MDASFSLFMKSRWDAFSEMSAGFPPFAEQASFRILNDFSPRRPKEGVLNLSVHIFFPSMLFRFFAKKITSAAVPFGVAPNILFLSPVQSGRESPILKTVPVFPFLRDNRKEALMPLGSLL